MEETMKEIKKKVADIDAGFRSMLKRFNQLADSSGCLGDLCKCTTFQKEAETQMKEIFKELKSFGMKMKEKDRRDKERDRKLEQLSQEITYMRCRQDVIKSQEREQKPSKKKSIREDDKKVGRSKQHKFHEQSPRRQSTTDSSESDENSSNSDYGESDLCNRLTHLHDSAKTSLTTNQENKPCKTEMDICEFEPKDGIPAGAEASYRPNIKPSTEVALRQTTSLAEPGSSLGSQQAISGTTLPAVVEQYEKEYYLTPGVWEIEAKAEQISGQKSSLRWLEAVTTILLIDTSQSMASGEKWTQVKTFVNDYITELEQLSPRVNHLEYLALVTYGAQTRCHQRHTTDFKLIRSSFDKLQLGGPSPLYGGLLMAEAVSTTPEKTLIVLGNGMHVYSKIILITDGEPTEICLHRGPDIPDPKQIDETQATLISLMDALSTRAIDIFCVPVENANTDCLHMLFSKEGGRRFLSYKDGSYFARRLNLYTKFVPLRNLFGGITFHIPRDDPEITARDYAHMQEILDDSNAKDYEAMKRKERNPYEVSANTQLLPIGSRVRRGPDWDDDVKDNDGPGTVIGHNLYVDRLWVNWDNGDEIGQCSYGERGRYCVLSVEEPRIPLPGQPLGVGCVVSTGKDWKSGVTSPGSRGVIIKMGVTDTGTRKALVHWWENGKMAAHSYGDDKIFEIQLCVTDTSVPTMQRTPRLPALPSSVQRPAIKNPAITGSKTCSGNSAKQDQSSRKNKNKNIH